MSRVSLHHHRAAGGQRASGVSTGNRKGEGEVGCSVYRDRTQRNQHTSEVRTGQWLTVGQSGVDAGIDPRSLGNEIGKHAKLPHGAATLAVQSSRR
jgi:hypothetical protein